MNQYKDPNTDTSKEGQTNVTQSRNETKQNNNTNINQHTESKLPQTNETNHYQLRIPSTTKPTKSTKSTNNNINPIEDLTNQKEQTEMLEHRY